MHLLLNFKSRHTGKEVSCSKSSLAQTSGELSPITSCMTLTGYHFSWPAFLHLKERRVGLEERISNAVVSCTLGSSGS